MQSVRQLLLLSALCYLFPLSAQQPPPNVLLICIDDLRPELASFGADYIISPHIDSLTRSGRPFLRHYVNAPSCGPSRHTLLTGTYGPSPNEAIFDRATALAAGADLPPSLPEYFRDQGYRTVSVGKVSHHPGGFGGEDWNDSTIVELPGAWDAALMPVDEWQTPRGSMHGLANGEIRSREPYTMPPLQAAAGSDSIYPDGRITGAALRQLDSLATGDQPFFLAVGLIKPHLPFGAPRRYLDLYATTELPLIPNPEQPQGISTWHESGEFRRYRLAADPLTDAAYATTLRKHYAACVSYADAQVGKLLQRLRETGQDTNTIVVLWGDHGWNLGHHAIWGKHNLFEEGLHSPLIVRTPGLPQPGQATEAIVETVDLYPTLCELAGLPLPPALHGSSFAADVTHPDLPGDPAAGYYQQATTLRTDRYRLIAHPGGQYELYDHQTDPYEQRNITEMKPELVAELAEVLAHKLTPRIVNY